EDLSQNERIFKCNIINQNLFNCIVDELNQQKAIIDDPAKLHSETIVNCLNAGLITCLGRSLKELKLEKNPPKVEFLAKKNEKGVWRIKHITLITNIALDDEAIRNRIKMCLNYYKSACKIDKSIDFSVTNPKIENFHNYTIQLLELKNWLKEVNENKKKKTKLIDAFNKFQSP
ncbi:MAG: hypothetical protein ACTSQG_07770, partial [Promethearchaeota archaeon]